MQRKAATIPSVVGKEREEDLTLFHEVRRRERERKSSAIHPLPPHDADVVSIETSIKHQTALSSIARMTPSYLGGDVAALDPRPSDLGGTSDDLLAVELGKNDYDWLLTPPGTPSYNHSIQNSASADSDLSQAEPLSLVHSLAAIKTSRFSSSKPEPKIVQDGAGFSELAFRKSQNGISRYNGLSSSSMLSTSSVDASSTKKTPLTPRSGSAARPRSPANRPLVSSAHKSNPSTASSKSKSFSAPGSLSTVPTSRYSTSKGEGNSVFATSTPSRKTAPSSPVFVSIKTSPSLTQKQPLSAGVSRSSSVNKVRPQPSRSAPSSRGSSPVGNTHDWKQAVLPNSHRFSTISSYTTNSGLHSNLPSSVNIRASVVASSPKPAAASSARQSLFSSSNFMEASMDIPKKACAPSFTRGKCALLKMDRQTSLGLIMSRSSIQLDKGQGDTVTSCIKIENKIHSKQSPESSVSSDVNGSRRHAKHPQGKCAPLVSNGDHCLSKHGPRRTLHEDMEMLSLHRGVPDALCLHATSQQVYSPLSARKMVPQDNSNNVIIANHSKAKADSSISASYGQGGRARAEDLKHGSDFQLLLADQTDMLSSFVKDDDMGNWLESPVCMDEGPDLMNVIEQSSGKFRECESRLVCPHGGGAGTCDLCNVKMRLQMLNEKSKVSFGANSQILSEA